MLQIAIAKGRIFESLLPALINMGFSASDLSSRKLILTAPDGRTRLIFLKSKDIATTVAEGSVDVGIVGSDVVLESQRFLYELETLPIATCKLCLAGPVGGSLPLGPIRIATKYPHLTTKLFSKRGQPLTIIALEGSVEIAPLIGLADVIVDIVESGRTLKANALEVYEDLLAIQPTIIANPISYKRQKKRIDAWISALRPSFIDPPINEKSKSSIQGDCYEPLCL